MPKVMQRYYKSLVDTFQANEEPGTSNGLPPRSARRRGRPRGNPTPLNEEQKKQRNAQYERERRNEAAEAMTDLQDAMGLNGRVSNNVIIGTALNFLIDHNTNPREDMDEMRRINQSLQDQIAKLESMIAGNTDDEEEHENDDSNENVDDDTDVEEEQHEELCQDTQPIEEVHQEAQPIDEYQETLPETAAYTLGFGDNYYYNDGSYLDGTLSEIVGLLE